MCTLRRCSVKWSFLKKPSSPTLVQKFPGLEASGQSKQSKLLTFPGDAKVATPAKRSPLGGTTGVASSLRPDDAVEGVAVESAPPTWVH